MRLPLVTALCFLSLLWHAPAMATQVQEVVSPGGLTAWLVEEHSVPLVAVKIAFRHSGYAYDPPGKEGRALLTGDMLVEGAGDMDDRTFSEALENQAVALAFSAGEDSFRGSMSCLSEYKDAAFSYLGLALTSPRFDAAAIERVRRQSLAALTEQEQQPGYMLARAWQKLAFPGHPYGNPAIGTATSIAALGKSDFQDYMRRYLTRSNMVIAVVGDITPKELGALLDAHLSGLSGHYDPDVTVPDIMLPARANQTVVVHDIPQTMVRFGANGIRRDDPHFYAAYVMNYILGGDSLTSRLGTEIREKRGLAYSVSSGLAALDHAAYWQGGFATRNAEAGHALDTLRATLADFAANGPSDDELARAKQFITGSFVLALDTNGDIANYLITMQLEHLGRDYLDKRNGLMLAVRKDDVRALARDLTDPRKLQVVMVGNPVLQ